MPHLYASHLYASHLYASHLYDSHLYASSVCLTCMPHMYASHLYAFHMYAFHMYELGLLVATNSAPSRRLFDYLLRTNSCSRIVFVNSAFFVPKSGRSRPIFKEVMVLLVRQTEVY